MSMANKRMRFAMFSSFCPAAGPPNLWYHKDSVDFDYLNLQHWIKLAKDLEEAKFDCIFWADHSGLHDTFRNSYAPALELALQFPIADPMLLAAALASSTTNLGLTVSANVIQHHPYVFARKLATLDHLLGGRLSWNVVTSFQKTAWQNQGFEAVEPHPVRYARGEEYLDVIYKLLEGSWEDDAVVRDMTKHVYADPSKVHEIHHHGEFYKVPGINTVEPSPQRTPFLFQAGSSKEGRDFSANNAEAIFIFGTAENTLASMKPTIADMAQRLIACGRRPSDLLIFAGRNYILGSTEEEAKRLDLEIQQMHRESDYCPAYMSSMMGVDLGKIDLDTPIGEFETDAVQGPFKMLADSAPSKQSTFRDVALSISGNRFVGTPEQAADEIEEWYDAGIRGINYQQMTGVGEVYNFINEVCPILKKRGLMQTEYAPGTMREKLFAGTDSPSGPTLNDRHRAAAYRHR